MNYEIFERCLGKIGSLSAPFFWREEYYYVQQEGESSFPFMLEDIGDINLASSNSFIKIEEFLLILGEEAGFLPGFTDKLGDSAKVTAAGDDYYDDSFRIKSAFLDRAMELSGFRIDSELSYSSNMSEVRDVLSDFRDLPSVFRDKLYEADSYESFDMVEDDEDDEYLTRVGEEYFEGHNVVLTICCDELSRFKKTLSNALKRGIISERQSPLNRLVSQFGCCCNYMDCGAYYDEIEYKDRHVSSFFTFDLADGYYQDIYELPIEAYVPVSNMLKMLDFSKALKEEKKNLAKAKREYKKAKI